MNESVATGTRRNFQSTGTGEIVLELRSDTRTPCVVSTDSRGGRSLLGFARELLRRGPAEPPETSLLLRLLALLADAALLARARRGGSRERGSERRGEKVRKRDARWTTHDARDCDGGRRAIGARDGRGTHLRLLPPSGGRGRLIHAGGRGDRSAVPARARRGGPPGSARAGSFTAAITDFSRPRVSQNSSGEIGATRKSSSGGGSNRRQSVRRAPQIAPHARVAPRPRQWPPPRPPPASAAPPARSSRWTTTRGPRFARRWSFTFPIPTCPATSSSARRLRRTPRGSWTSRCWRRSRACARSSRRSAARITTRPSPRWWTCFEPPPSSP